jgi:hypothetical protein
MQLAAALWWKLCARCALTPFLYGALVSCVCWRGYYYCAAKAPHLVHRRCLTFPQSCLVACQRRPLLYAWSCSRSSFCTLLGRGCHQLLWFFWCINYILTLMLFLFGDVESFVGWCYPPSLTFPLQNWTSPLLYHQRFSHPVLKGSSPPVFLTHRWWNSNRQW